MKATYRALVTSVMLEISLCTMYDLQLYQCTLCSDHLLKDYHSVFMPLVVLFNSPYSSVGLI